MINGLDKSLSRRKLSDWSSAVGGLTQTYIAALLKFSQPRRKSAPPSDDKNEKRRTWQIPQGSFVSLRSEWSLLWSHTWLQLNGGTLTSGLSTITSCFSTADEKLWIFSVCDLD